MKRLHCSVAGRRDGRRHDVGAAAARHRGAAAGADRRICRYAEACRLQEGRRRAASTRWRSSRRRWSTRSSASASSASRNSRRRSYLTGLLEKNGFTVQRGVAGIPDRVGRDVGLGQAGHRARLRHRRHSAGVAEARRRLSRSDHRRRAGSRRRPQLRHAAQHRRGDRGEADHGARQAAGHAHAVAGRRRRAARHQGVVRARRRVQGRRRRALHARRQQPRRVVGRGRRQRAWCRSNTPSRARPRTAPARRGAAARRSTPSS